MIKSIGYCALYVGQTLLFVRYKLRPLKVNDLNINAVYDLLYTSPFTR